MTSPIKRPRIEFKPPVAKVTPLPDVLQGESGYVYTRELTIELVGILEAEISDCVAQVESSLSGKALTDQTGKMARIASSELGVSVENISYDTYKQLVESKSTSGITSIYENKANSVWGDVSVSLLSAVKSIPAECARIKALLESGNADHLLETICSWAGQARSFVEDARRVSLATPNADLEDEILQYKDQAIEVQKAAVTGSSQHITDTKKAVSRIKTLYDPQSGVYDTVTSSAASPTVKTSGVVASIIDKASTESKKSAAQSAYDLDYRVEAFTEASDALIKAASALKVTQIVVSTLSDVGGATESQVSDVFSVDIAATDADSPISAPTPSLVAQTSSGTASLDTYDLSTFVAKEDFDYLKSILFFDGTETINGDNIGLGSTNLGALLVGSKPLILDVSWGENMRVVSTDSTLDPANNYVLAHSDGTAILDINDVTGSYAITAGVVHLDGSETNGELIEASEADRVYWLYLSVDPDSGTADIVAFTSKQDATDTLVRLGVWTTTGDAGRLITSYGITLINGNQIITGTVVADTVMGGKDSFSDASAGYWIGRDVDSVYKLIIGGDEGRLVWDGASFTISYGGVPVPDLIDNKINDFVTGQYANDSERWNQNGVTVILTNESATFAAASDGTVTDFSAGSGIFKVYDGTADMTGTGTVFSVQAMTGCVATINAATGVYSVSSMSADTATVQFKVVYETVSYYKTLTLAKARAGSDGSDGSSGANAKLLTLSGAQVFSYNTSGALVGPASITITGTRQNITSTTYTWTYGLNGASPTNALNAEASKVVFGTDTVQIFPDATIWGSARSLTVKAVIDGVSDTFTIYKVADGANGTNGVSARQVDLTCPSQAFTYTAAGTTPSPSSVVITATAQNTSGTVYYEFLVGASSVQNTTGNTYTYTPQAAFSNMPQQITVKIRENSSSGTVLATDTISMFGVKPGTNGSNGTNGVDAIMGVLTNEACVIPATSAGTGYSLTSAGGTFKMYSGTGDVTTSSVFTITGGVDGGTSWTKTQNGLTMTIAETTGVYSLSGASWTTDSETFTLTGQYNGVVISKTYTISKSKAGTNGTNGTNGSNGADARVVGLSTPTQAFTYTAAGTTPSPANSVLTATALNTSGTVYYEFTVAGSSVQNTTTNTYTYTPQASWSNMPQAVVVKIREGSSTGTVLATDTMTMIGVKPGTNGTNGTNGVSAVSGVLTNESVTIPTDSAGNNGNYENATTTLKMFFGSTEDTSNWTYTQATSEGVVPGSSNYVAPLQILSTDGYVRNSGTVWSTVRDAAIGNMASTTSTTNNLSTYLSGSVYYLYRGFFAYDKTGLSTATAGTITLVKAVGTNDTGYLCLFQGTQSDSLVNDDFDAFTGPELAARVQCPTVVGDSVTFTLNAAGLAYVNSQTGVCKFCVRTAADVDNVAPTLNYTGYFGTMNNLDPSLRPTATLSCNGTTNTTNTYTAVTMTTDTGYVDITAHKNGFSDVTKRFTLTKSKAGTDGISPTAYWLVPAMSVLTKSQAGTFTPATITARIWSQAGTEDPATYASGRYKVYYDSGAGFILDYTSIADEASMPAYTIRPESLAIKIEAYRSGSTSLSYKVDEQTIPVVVDGPAGADGNDGDPGADAITGFITNDSSVVAASVDGLTFSLASSGGTFKMFEGVVDKSASSAYAVSGGSVVGGNSIKTQNNLTMTINTTTGAYSLAGTWDSSDIESFTLTGTYGGVTVSKVYTIAKSRAGGNAATMSITTSGSVFKKGLDGVVSPSGGITLSTSCQNITGCTYVWKKDGVDIGGATASSYTVSAADYSSSVTHTYTCTATGTVNGVAGRALSDSVTIPRVDDGGPAITTTLSNENISFAGPTSGYSGITFTYGSCVVNAYVGSTKLNYGTTGANTFSVAISSVGVTVANGTGSGQDYTIPAPTAMSSDNAVTTVNIYIRDAAAAQTVITRSITYSLSRSGATGNHAVQIFARSSTGADHPSIVVTDNNPVGWASSPPAGTGGVMWMSTTIKNGAGVIQQNWSEPISMPNYTGVANEIVTIDATGVNVESPATGTKANLSSSALSFGYKAGPTQYSETIRIDSEETKLTDVSSYGDINSYGSLNVEGQAHMPDETTFGYVPGGGGYAVFVRRDSTGISFDFA